MTTRPAFPASLRLARSLSVAFLLVALATRVADAQTPPGLVRRSLDAGGVVTGVVIDGEGKALPGARVTVTNGSGTIARTTTTDGAGEFVIGGLQPGTYALVVEMHLFSPSTETVTVG